MNYIELINQFWRMRRSKILTSIEADLYYYLMNVCNELNWENPFEHPNTLICATIGCTEKTMIAARNRLKQKGLIDFKPGVRKKRSPVYQLLYCNDSSKKESIKESKNDSKKGSKTGNLNTKLNENKDTSTTSPNDNEPQMNYNEFIDYYHLNCPRLPKVKALSEARKKAIKARVKEHGEVSVKQMIENAGKSDFMCGNNNRNWTATFDWIFKPTNFVKVLDGNYANRNNGNTQGNNGRGSQEPQRTEQALSGLAARLEAEDCTVG